MSVPRSPARFAAGIAIWVAMIGGVASFAMARSQELRPSASKVVRYATHAPARIERRIEAIDDGHGWDYPGAGDPVLAADSRAFLGTIEAVTPIDVAATATPAYTVRIVLDPEYDPKDFEGARFEYGSTTGDFVWIIETLIPPAKREII